MSLIALNFTLENFHYVIITHKKYYVCLNEKLVKFSKVPRAYYAKETLSILLNDNHITKNENMNEPCDEHTQHSSSLRVSLIKREKDTFKYSGVVYRKFKNESIDKY